MKEQGKARTGKVDRRAFLKTATAGLAVAGFGGVFQIMGRPAHASTRCRVLMTPTAKLTPPTINDGAGQAVANMIHEWLLRLEGPEGKLTPSLAKAIPTTRK